MTNSYMGVGSAIKIPIVFLAFGFSLILVLSLGVGFKWFFVSFVGISLACVATIFFDYRLFCLILLCGGIPIDIQYDFLNHGKKYLTVEHWGGAVDSFVMHLTDFPLLILLLVWLIDLSLGYKKLPDWTRFDTYSVLFLVISSCSLINTEEHLLLFAELFRYCKYFLLLWILRTYLDNKEYFWWVLCSIVLMVLLESFVAFLQYFLYFNVPFPVGGVTGSQFEMVNNIVIQRVTGLVGFCNTFAAYLLFPILLAFTLMISRSHYMIRLVASGLFVSGCLAIVLTFSRNSWMVLMFGLITATFIGIKKKNISLSLILGLCGLAITVFGFLLSSEVFQTILIRIFEDDGKAYDSRWDLFMVAVEMFITYPFFGAGLNSFEEIMSRYDNSGVVNIIQQPVHNIYCLIAAETGVFALIMFLVVVYYVLKRAYAMLNNQDNLSFVIGCSSFSIFVSLSIDNFFDITLRKEPIIGMAVLFLALILSYDILKQDKINDELC